MVGALLAANGRLEAAILPLLTLLAVAAFLPVSEIANVGRQLADTFASARRLQAGHNEKGPGTHGAAPPPRPAPGGSARRVAPVGFPLPRTPPPPPPGGGL